MATSLTSAIPSTISKNNFQLWLLCLGHASDFYLNKLVSSGILDNISTHSISYIDCKLSKQTAFSYNNRVTTSRYRFDIIHSDVWGPSQDPTMGDSRYYIIFIDDVSRFTWLYLLKSHDEVFSTYKSFAMMIYIQFSSCIKTLQMDSGGEYLSTKLKHILHLEGTISQLSCPHTSQQNGVSERKHRHIIKTTRIMLLSSGLPKTFLGGAILTSIYIIDRLSNSAINMKTLYGKIFDKQPVYSHLQSFGYTCFVLLPSNECNKLLACSTVCFLVM